MAKKKKKFFLFFFFAQEAMLLTVTLLSFQSHCMCCLDCSTVSCSVSAPCAPQQPAPPSLVQPSSQCSSSSVVPSLIPLACDSPPLSTCTETPCLNLVFVCFIYSLPVVSLVCGVSLFLPWSWIKLHPLDIPATSSDFIVTPAWFIYPTNAAVSFFMFCIPQKQNLCIRTAASVIPYLSPSLSHTLLLLDSIKSPRN